MNLARSRRLRGRCCCSTLTRHSITVSQAISRPAQVNGGQASDAAEQLVNDITPFSGLVLDRTTQIALEFEHMESPKLDASCSL